MPHKNGPAQLVVHDEDSAPEESKPLLAKIDKKFGFTPSLYGIFAASPPVLQAALEISEQFSRTSLSTQEQNAVLLAVAVANKCHFCKAAHTWTSKGAGIPDSDIEALRNGEPPADPRLAAVARITTHLVERRGFASEEELQAFIDSGFERHQVLEVVLGITLKTLTNYTNHLADTPLNEQLAPFA